MIENLKAFKSAVFSYLKAENDWTIQDYPIRIRDQGEKVPKASRYGAQIISWWAMTGIGASPEEAIKKLSENLENYKKNKGSIPRPGTKVPLEFASGAKFDELTRTDEPLVDEFFKKIIGQDFRRCFISDQSSVYDFEELRSQHDAIYVKKINEAFGLSLRDDDKLLISDVIGKISEKRCHK